MDHGLFKNEARVLSRWTGLLLLLGVIAFGVNVAIYQAVQELRANSPWTYVKEGQARLAAKDPEGALELFEYAASLDDASPLPWEHIGLLHYERKEFAKSAKAYEEAFARDSQSTDAHGKALWAYIHTKRYDDAIALGYKSMEAGLATPEFPRWIGDAYYRAKRFEECIPHFEQALREQEDLHVMSKLASAYEKTGRIKQAEAMRQRIETLEAS